MITFHVITIFPSIIESYLKESIIGRAIKNRKIKVRIYNPRDFTTDKHHKVDHKPYGGGPGMVLDALPILKVVKKIKRNKKVKIILFAARGKKFTNIKADTLKKGYKDIILIAGRYEGIDSRVRKALRAEEISVGDYVLTGGELPALIVIDALTRRIPGVLGQENSIEEKRMASKEMYTRPEKLTFEGKEYRVPKVLISGDHKKIEEWRKNNM